MLKKKNLVLILLLLIVIVGVFAFGGNIVYAKETDYVFIIKNYNINVIVNENNTLTITEDIDVFFNESSHGIIREIPLINNVSRMDGTTDKIKCEISDIDVDNEYTITKTKNDVEIKIGDADKVIEGDKKYIISYTYNLGKDKCDDLDEFYYNIIGTEWDTCIEKVEFTIQMPKNFDKSLLGFASGRVGSTTSNNVEYSVTGNTITGYTISELYEGEALTIRVELPDGYFVGAKDPSIFTTEMFIFVFAPVVMLGIALIIWYIFGKDKFVPETVEFYPPEGLNSADIDAIYRGSYSNKGIISLILDFASKGYIKIYEAVRKRWIRTQNVMVLVKLKDYNGDNAYIKSFFAGLFNGDACDMANLTFLGDVKKDDVIKNGCYGVVGTDNTRSIKNIIRTTDSLNNNKIQKYYNQISPIHSIIMIIMAMLSLFCSYAIAVYETYVSVLMVLITLVAVISIGLNKEMPLLIKTIIVLFFIVIPYFTSVLGMGENALTICLSIIEFLIVVAILMLKHNLKKKNDLGDKLHARIKGFRRFIITAEKERIQEMQEKDADYFYHILPYAYIFGVYNKWIKKFEGMVLPKVMGLTDGAVNNAATTMSSMSRRIRFYKFSSFMSSGGSSGGKSSGSGSSRGGYSGRGSGGGGGRAW